LKYGKRRCLVVVEKGGNGLGFGGKHLRRLPRDLCPKITAVSGGRR